MTDLRYFSAELIPDELLIATRHLLANLRPGGDLFVEDFVCLAPFTLSELSALNIAVRAC